MQVLHRYLLRLTQAEARRSPALNSAAQVSAFRVDANPCQPDTSLLNLIVRFGNQDWPRLQSEHRPSPAGKLP